MNLYSTGIHISATVYVKAENEEQALDKIRKLGLTESQAMEFKFSGDIISDRGLDDPYLPDISLSPVMTCLGLEGGDGNMTDLCEFDVALKDISEG